MKMSPAVLAVLAVLLPACSELQPFTGGFQTASVPVEERQKAKGKRQKAKGDGSRLY